MTQLTGTSRYRHGDRDPEARAAKAAYDRHSRRRAAIDAMADVETVFLDDLADGTPLVEACERHGLTISAVHGRAQWDSGWRMRVDDALMAGRPEGARHGTPTGYRWDGCRCPACRRAHHPVRSERMPELWDS